MNCWGGLRPNKKAKSKAPDFKDQIHYNTRGGYQLRLKDIEVNPSTMRLEIDIIEQEESFAIVVCEGKARITELPSHGETKIVTHQGKVKRIKWDEGEEF